MVNQPFGMELFKHHLYNFYITNKYVFFHHQQGYNLLVPTAPNTETETVFVVVFWALNTFSEGIWSTTGHGSAHNFPPIQVAVALGLPVSPSRAFLEDGTMGCMANQAAS